MLVDCDTFKFQLLSLTIDIVLFTLGFHLLFKSIYKKLSREFMMTALLLSLTTPALSITEYYQGGEIVLSFTLTVWTLYLFSIKRTILMIALISLSYHFAPNTLWFNAPIFFCHIGQLVVQSDFIQENMGNKPPMFQLI